MTTQLLKQGEILERLVRRDRMGISELSRKLNVSRRTIYNWFGQDRIGHEVIWQVGKLLGQDLSSSFPEAFPKYSAEPSNQTADPGKQAGSDSNSVYFWMNKYIHLLEKYNDLLITEEQHESDPIGKEFPLRNKRSETFLYQ
ncbi:helix-turn-helix domain-containing protein [Pedobacter sp. GSP4]|uniref:helix-turn-helix domain-containing protein n=1 Tax=Pedobacter sp. GSP4 TaxID=3453716 RepID=UPI003EED4246